MKIILGSKSPRRQQLLQEMGITFELRIKDTDESYPDHLEPVEVARFIAMQKAKALQPDLNTDEVLITADTIVCVEHEILGKPENESEAKQMLRKLSGKMHQVITAVCVSDETTIKSDYAQTNVFVRPLTDTEIDYYVTHYKPFDKAGAYGIQEWFGAVAVEKIEGSYNNVVGLPTHLVYDLLKNKS
jgi:septum formation protein